MKIKVYTVDVQLPRWSKRVLHFAAMSVALVLSVVAVVRAATSSVPNTFADGDTLSATKMNANFGALQSQLDSTNATLTTVQQTMIAPDANGNVGIGTKSPAALLHLFRSAGSVPLLNIDATQSGNFLLFTNQSSSNKQWHFSPRSTDLVLSETGVADRITFQAGGNVGIGTTSPAYPLHVNGAVFIEGDNTVPLTIGGARFRSNGSGGWRGLSIDTYNGEFLSDRVFIDGNGSVGIKTTSPQYALDVAGTIRGDNLTPSDRSLKKNITSLPADILNRVQKLDGVSFEWDQQKASGYSTKPQIGLIAQEVDKVFPSLVETDAKGIKSIHYMGVTAVLLEAVKAQQRQIEDLKNHVRSLENRLSPAASAGTKAATGRRVARQGLL